MSNGKMTRTGNTKALRDHEIQIENFEHFECLLLVSLSTASFSSMLSGILVLKEKLFSVIQYERQFASEEYCSQKAISKLEMEKERPFERKE
jgi:hypothetical protein